MASGNTEREKEIFWLALEELAENREYFVRHTCGDDQRRYEAVMELLRKHYAAEKFMEDPPPFFEISTASQSRPRLENFNQRFELRRELGSGGFGTVFEAFDRKNETVVALKLLNRAEAAGLRMFKREFRTLAEISHANLVQLYELIDDGQHWFFTMELVSGTDFVSHVRGDYVRLRSAFRQLVEVVSFIHARGMLHRDIKPPNIRITPEGQVKLLDFGLVRDVSPESTQETETFGGTAAYMAPELLTERTLREASDWYSVGAVLYEALTGEPPFHGSFFEIFARKQQEPVRAPRELAPDIPRDLNDLCLKLLERDPNVRMAGAAVLHELTAGRAASPERPAVLIGRESHLAALHDAFEEVCTGEPVCVHVQGQSGMGKSALCRRFLSDLRQHGALVLAGHCYVNESVPFKALDPIVDALGDYLKRLRGAGVAAYLPREKPLQALARVFPTLLQVDAISQSYIHSAGETSPRDLQRRAIVALKEMLARIGEKQRCVVYIDDLQWGDLDSVECLTSILGPPDPPRVLFLFSYRSEDVASSAHLQQLLAHQRNHDSYAGKFRELVVDPLTPSQSKQLFEELLGEGAELASQWLDRETEGMPLFIHELAMHARSGLQSENLSLQEMIQQRLRGLPSAARRMAEVVSLAAQPIEVEVIRKAARLDDGEHPARNALVAQNLIRYKSTDSGGQVEPYHDKIREAVVATLAPEAKRAYFQSLAEALEAREKTDAELVYQYFLSAGNLAKAEAWIEIAAERAERTLAFDLAVRLRERRIEMRAADEPERPVLLERLADALACAGRGLKAARAYQDAARAAPPGKYRELIRKAGEQYIRTGHFEEGQALLTGLLERIGFHIPAHRLEALVMLLARRAFLRLRGLGFTPRGPEQTSPEEAEVLDICRVASLAMALQDPIRAAELQTRHLLRSLRLGEPYRIANSLAMEAGYLAARGGAASYHETSKLLDKVQELVNQSNHPNAQTLAVSLRSKAAWLTGRWEESARYGEEVNRLATEQYTRVAWEAYPSSIFWMCSLAFMGRWREVIQHLPGLQADSQARGDLLEMTSLPVFTFAYIRWLLADEPERALAELESAKARLSEPGFIPHRFGVCYGLTDVALYQGKTEQARQSVAEGWAQLESAMALRIQPVRIFMLYGRARVACASAAAATGADSRNRFLADAMAGARRIRKERTDWASGMSDLIEATVAAEEHRLADAKRLLERAEAGCLRAGMSQFVAVARYRKAQLSQGDARREAEQQAAAWFDAQKVACPDRLIRLLSPGTWRVTP